MKNLLKVTAFLAVLFALANTADAAWYNIPADINGRVPGDASLVGVDVIDSTGSTTNYGLAAPCFLHWIAISSSAVSTYAVLRDSGTLNATSDIAMVVNSSGNQGAALQVLNFDPPVIFRNGLSIRLNENMTGSGRWMFGVRRLRDGTRNAHPTAGVSASD